MNSLRPLRFVACLAVVLSSMAVLSPTMAQTPAAQVPLTFPTRPLKGAIILFSGKESELKDLWLKRYTQEPSGWTTEKGVASPTNKSDIVTKQVFGDCFLHVEFRCPTEGEGNSGVCFQGRYEVQILNSFGKEPESHECGAFYSEKPPRVMASKKPGEWQTYDIFFRAPRFNAKGEVTEQPRATVIQNGILVQNNEEFTGMTGIQYGEYKDIVPTGPLLLQGDHNFVQFRNVWIVPM